MKLAYTLTLADYKAAQRLHIRRKITRRVLFYLYPIMTAIASIGALFGLICGNVVLSEIFLPLVAGGLACSICVEIGRFYGIRKCFKQLFHPARTDRNSSLDIDDERIVSAVPGVSEGKFFWSAILEFAQDEKITLLYVAEKRFLFFPTSALSPDQRVELDALIARNMVRKEK